jgi:hypothetical protein
VKESEIPSLAGGGGGGGGGGLVLPPAFIVVVVVVVVEVGVVVVYVGGVPVDCRGFPLSDLDCLWSVSGPCKVIAADLVAAVGGGCDCAGRISYRVPDHRGDGRKLFLLIFFQ